jgi:hypothetical protein
MAKVRTPAGAKFYGEPIGAEIVSHPKVPSIKVSKASLVGKHPTELSLEAAPSGTHFTVTLSNDYTRTFNKTHDGTWAVNDSSKKYTTEDIGEHLNNSNIKISAVEYHLKGVAPVGTYSATHNGADVDAAADDDGKKYAVVSQLDKVAKAQGIAGTVPKLTAIPDKGFQGSHPLKYYKDEDGKEYIAKAFPHDANGEKRVKIEDAANNIGSILGFGTPKSSVMKTPDGNTSFVQEIIPGSQLTNKGVAPKWSDMPTATISSLMQQQILDYLLSNTDAHGDNFLFNKGQVVGIDKGQAWKNFPNDKLSADYQAVAGKYDKPLYNFFFDAVKSGEITPEQYQQIKDEVLNRAMGVSDDFDKNSAIRDQLKSAFPDDPEKVKAIIERKNEIYNSFTKLYDDNEPKQSKVDKAVSLAANAKSAGSTKVVGDVLSSTADYENAPVGTVIQGSNSGSLFTKLGNGKWKSSGNYPAEYPSSDFAGSSDIYTVTNVPSGKATADVTAADKAAETKSKFNVYVGSTLSHTGYGNGDGNSDDFENAPVGTVIKSLSNGSTYKKIKGGDWVDVKDGSGNSYSQHSKYPPSAFVSNEYSLVSDNDSAPGLDPTTHPNADAKSAGSTKVGDVLSLTADYENAPVGTVITGPTGKSLFTKLGNGKWKSSGNYPAEYPSSDFAGSSTSGYTVTNVPGQAEIDKAAADKAAADKVAANSLDKAVSDAQKKLQIAEKKVEALKIKHSGKSAFDLTPTEHESIAGSQKDVVAAKHTLALALAKQAKVSKATEIVSAGEPEKSIYQLNQDKLDAQAARKTANIAREQFLENHPRASWSPEDKAEYKQLSDNSKQAQANYLLAKHALEVKQQGSASSTYDSDFVKMNDKDSGAYDTEFSEAGYSQLDAEGWEDLLPTVSYNENKEGYSAISSYVAGSGNLNSDLWQYGMNNSKKGVQNHAKQVEALDAAMKPIDKHTILYRGTFALNGLVGTENLSALVGTKQTLLGYSSTGYDTTPHIVNDKPVVIKFLIPAGNAEGIFAQNIGGLSGENEIILQRDLNIQVSGVEARHAYPGDETTIVTVVVLPSVKKTV